MLKQIKLLFNWKDHPENVFWLAIPLAIFGFGIMLYSAWLRLKFFNEVGPLIIWVVVTVLGVIALWPAFNYFRKRDR